MRRLLALTVIAILIPLAVVVVVNVAGGDTAPNAGLTGRKIGCC